MREDTLGDRSSRRSRKGSGPHYKLDLDLSKDWLMLGNNTDDDLSLSDTSFDDHLSESSFLPTIKEQTKQVRIELRLERDGHTSSFTTQRFKELSQ